MEALDFWVFPVSEKYFKIDLQNAIDFCNISILVAENATRSLKIRTDEPISVGTEDWSRERLKKSEVLTKPKIDN